MRYRKGLNLRVSFSSSEDNQTLRGLQNCAPRESNVLIGRGFPLSKQRPAASSGLSVSSGETIRAAGWGGEREGTSNQALGVLGGAGRHLAAREAEGSQSEPAFLEPWSAPPPKVTDSLLFSAALGAARADRAVIGLAKGGSWAWPPTGKGRGGLGDWQALP